MSAFLVSHAHIDAIVTWAAQRSITLCYHRADPPVTITTHLKIDSETATSVGRFLLTENYCTVNGHYWTTEEMRAYVYRQDTQTRSVTEVLKLLDCYDNQTADPVYYDRSCAAAIIRAIRARAITELPGYSDAPWHIDE